MIRKSGNRFSEKIMLKQRDEVMIRFQPNRIMIWASAVMPAKVHGCLDVMAVQRSRLSRGWGAVSGALPQQNTENPPGVANASILTSVRAASGFLGALMAPGFWN
jgi:hypothetical protein